MNYASDFNGILNAFDTNELLRNRILKLIESENIVGKVVEGDDRIELLRGILIDYFTGNASYEQSIKDIEFKLPRHYSPYENDNRVFARGWEDRLLITNVSCFYNQAVLLEILEAGETECFIDHSDSEKADSKCSQELAGSKHNAYELLEKLVSAYREGVFSNNLKIPHHPHCTHTVQPV